MIHFHVFGCARTQVHGILYVITVYALQIEFKTFCSWWYLTHLRVRSLFCQCFSLACNWWLRQLWFEWNMTYAFKVDCKILLAVRVQRWAFSLAIGYWEQAFNFRLHQRCRDHVIWFVWWFSRRTSIQLIWWLTKQLIPTCETQHWSKSKNWTLLIGNVHDEYPLIQRLEHITSSIELWQFILDLRASW